MLWILHIWHFAKMSDFAKRFSGSVGRQMRHGRRLNIAPDFRRGSQSAVTDAAAWGAGNSRRRPDFGASCCAAWLTAGLPLELFHAAHAVHREDACSNCAYVKHHFWIGSLLRRFKGCDGAKTSRIGSRGELDSYRRDTPA